MTTTTTPLWDAFAETFEKMHGFRPRPGDKLALEYFHFYRHGAESQLPTIPPDPAPTIHDLNPDQWKKVWERLYPHFKGTTSEAPMWAIFAEIRSRMDEKRRGGVSWIPDHKRV